MGLKEDMGVIRRRFLAETGNPIKTLWCSGAVLIAMYELGFLRPDDQSIRVCVPDADRQMVAEFLKRSKGAR